MTECGRHLSISFNVEAAQLTLKHNGDDVEKLPEVKKELMICRNKITKSSTSDQRITQFHTIYDNVRQVISVTYFKKRKYLEVRLNKAKEFVRGYEIFFPSTVHHFNLFLLLFRLLHWLNHCNLHDLYRKKLTQQGVFPLKLQDGET